MQTSSFKTFIVSNSRRWIRRVGIFALITGVIWLIVTVGLLLVVHTWGISRPLPTPADAIVVLGAGVNRNGQAGPALTRRSTLGAQLYAQGLASVMICTGAQPSDRPNTEARACRDVLLRLGVPENAIVLEEQSRSTEENALYSARIFQEAGWSRALVVTDSFHGLRADWLFRLQGLSVQLATVPPRGSSEYIWSLLRDVAALQWQVIKEILQLPITHVPLL